MGDQDKNVAPSGSGGGQNIAPLVAAGAAGAGQTGQVGETAINKGAGADAGVTEEELKKSMDKLEGIVANTPEGRKNALFAKGGKEGLSEAENLELMKLLGGEPIGKSLKTDVAGVLTPSDTLEKSLDVSPFIEHLNENLTKSMLVVAEHVEKSDLRHQEQIVVLAKGLLDLGKVVHEGIQLQKSVAERLGIALRQPARMPKAAGAGGQQPQALEKGFAGGQPQGEQLSKSEVGQLISEMLQDSLANGQKGLSKGGFDITVESSQYEQYNDFSSPAFRAEVIDFARSKRQQRMNGNAR